MLTQLWRYECFPTQVSGAVHAYRAAPLLPWTIWYDTLDGPYIATRWRTRHALAHAILIAVRADNSAMEELEITLSEEEEEGAEDE